MVMGSPGWIPPERLKRQPATPASDVFGWGCLVAYAGTGRNPFGTGDTEELARRVLFEPPDLTGLDDPLRGLVAEALAKEPDDRPSAADLLALLSSTGAWRTLGAAGAPGGSGASGGPGSRGGLGSPRGSGRWGKRGTAVGIGAAGEPGSPEGSGTTELPAVRRVRVLPAVAALAAAAALVAVIVIATNHDARPATPPAPTPTATPPGAHATTHHVPNPHHGGPRIAPDHPGAGTTPPTQEERGRHRGEGKGKGKEKGNGKGKSSGSEGPGG